MEYIKHQPLREDGPFAIETYSRITTGYKIQDDKYAVVYADNNQPSNCVWLVPGTWDI